MHTSAASSVSSQNMILKYQNSILSIQRGKKSSIMHAADSTHTTSQNKSTSRRKITRRKKCAATTTIESKTRTRGGIDADEDKCSLSKHGVQGHIDIGYYEKRKILMQPYPQSSSAFLPSRDSSYIKPQYIKPSTNTN